MLKHSNNKKKKTPVSAKYSGKVNIPRDKNKSLILSEKLASLQYKRGILKGKRVNQNKPTENRYVILLESRERGRKCKRPRRAKNRTTTKNRLLTVPSGNWMCARY